VSGLVIPPDAFSSGNFEVSAEVTNDPLKCPLCKVTIAESSNEFARALHSALVNANLGSAEAISLLRLMRDQYLEGSAHPDVSAAIETQVPKAAGLMKLVPPGDVTGAIALIISVLALADDLVANWIAPRAITINNATRRSAEPPTSAIELSSYGPIPHSATNPGSVTGYWHGGPEQALHYYSFSTGPGVRVSYSGLVSDSPGSFEWHLKRDPEIEHFVNVLFISGDEFARSFADHRFSMSKLAEIEAFPFIFAPLSRSEFTIGVISRGLWLSDFQKFRR
jgi:hypothetical protein